MLLYIVRHAWAFDRDDDQWPDDRQRPLTKQGRKRFAEVVAKLAKRGFAPQMIASSPLVRCLETAEVLAGGLPGRPLVTPLEALAPDSDLEALLTWMATEAAQYQEVAWVGHAPDVGQLAAALIGGGSAAIDFSKGGVAAIRFDDRPVAGTGELRWLATAKLLGC